MIGAGRHYGATARKYITAKTLGGRCWLPMLVTDVGHLMRLQAEAGEKEDRPTHSEAVGCKMTRDENGAVLCDGQ